MSVREFVEDRVREEIKNSTAEVDRPSYQYMVNRFEEKILQEIEEIRFAVGCLAYDATGGKGEPIYKLHEDETRSH